MILAGAEAAATLIRGIMMLLIGTPRVYSEFKAEIKDSVNRGIASSPIKSVEARKLPYLQVSKQLSATDSSLSAGQVFVLSAINYI